MSSRYVLVSTNLADKVIKGGPVLWDGVSPYPPPQGQSLMLEADALTAGYTYPPLPLAVTNTLSLQAKAANALATNIAYLAIPSPTNAQAGAQVAALTRQVDALIRLAVGEVNSTDGS